MSSPAIVLMTDPARCNLGDMHHLVQALLEMQQMGEHAIPQAFCDHPEAARDFLDAYVHAYPQLVLEDRAIPTPDDLQSLISTGRINALGRLPEPSQNGHLPPPAEPSGAAAFPIVVLTLGSSQVLLEALQQSPTIRDSVRLIDVVQERGDVPSVSIADAVVSRGLDGESWGRARSSIERSELDDIPGAAKSELASLALHDDQVSLDLVDVASGGWRAAGSGEPEPDAAEVIAAAAKPAPTATEERAGSASSDGRSNAVSADDGRSPAAEPAGEVASQPVASRPTESEPVAPEARTPEEEAPGEAAGDGSEVDDGDGDEVSQEPGRENNKADAGKGDKKACGDKPGKKGAKEVDEAEAANATAPGAFDGEDDVVYPPAGSLLAGADVLYPIHDRGGAHAALQELAGVLLDEGIFDADRASDLFGTPQGEATPMLARQETIAPPRPADKVVTFAEAYGACDQEGEDDLADAAMRPLHDSDL